MGLGWAGFLSGMGQGLERASGSVDQYVAQKKLAQQLAMQQAQQEHMIAQDALAQKNFLAREASDKEKEDDRRKLVRRQVINEDLMNMQNDQMPMASMPQDWQNDARQFAPTQIAYQPPSMGKSDPIKGEVGPSEGGEMVNRFVTPGERNNMRSMESALTRSQQGNDIKQAQIDMLANRYQNTNDLGYARIDDADRRARAKAEQEQLAKHKRDGQYAYSSAVRNYNSWAKDQAKTIEGMGTTIPPEIRSQMLGRFFEEALTPLGKTPADYPEASAQMGINLNPQIEEPQPGPKPPPAAPQPGFFERLFSSSTARPPAAPAAPPPPAAAAAAPPVAAAPPAAAPPPVEQSALGKWLSEDPRAKLRQERANPPPPVPPEPPRGPEYGGGFNKTVSIHELRQLLPILSGHGIKSDKDLLNYARTEGFTVTG
jgi:hypothetical protein